MHDDLVDDDLGEQRGGQADELDGQAGEQDCRDAPRAPADNYRKFALIVECTARPARPPTIRATPLPA